MKEIKTILSRDQSTISKKKHKPLITFSWERINVTTPEITARNWPIFGRKGVSSKRIVKNVSGVAKPGTLTAIIGASGAGKTTLLNVLNFRNRGTLKIKGDVKVNGSLVETGFALSAISGYVQQESLFISTLKVGEMLRFQANLKMDKALTQEERLKRIEEILNELNLKKCENVLIGEPEQGMKGISGGEKRRLAFGCELITNPNLLFCDEPTSGLDSFMAMTIVESMRRLAEQGKTIICTIHQPSSEVFEKFDHLLLMAEGRVAYLGDTKGCGDFFASQGLVCPSNYNPAEYYIQNLAIHPSARDESLKLINKICDGFEQSEYAKIVKDDIKSANELKSKPETAIKLVNNIKYNVNIFVQFRHLLWRSIITNLRDPFSTRMAIIQNIIIAIFLGLIFLQVPYTQAGIQNINGVMFLMLINSSFSNLLGVLHLFPPEIPLFLREHQDAMYGVTPYFISKQIADFPKFVIMKIFYIIIVYWMSDLYPDAGRFFLCMLIIILVAMTSISFGTFISVISPSADAALSISGPILMPLMIFSGFFLNNSSVPVYFIWLRYMSWFNYANELMIINQWSGVTGLKCSNSSSKCFTSGDEIITYYNMSQDNYGVDFGAIFALLIGWRLLAYLVLIFKANRR